MYVPQKEKAGFLLSNLHFEGLGGIGHKIKLYARDGAHGQYNLLHTIFNHMFDLDLPENIYTSFLEIRPRVSRFSRLLYRYFPGGPKSKI